MGTDKATLLVDGVPMAVRVADALRAAGAEAVVVIGRAVAGEAVVDDDHPGEGPVGGVLTALAWAGDRRVVVAPCDLVAPAAESFRRLVATGADALAVVAGSGDPLPMALRPEAAPVLARAFADGERGLRRAVAALAPVVADLPVDAVADADTPAELPPGAG